MGAPTSLQLARPSRRRPLNRRLPLPSYSIAGIALVFLSASQMTRRRTTAERRRVGRSWAADLISLPLQYRRNLQEVDMNDAPGRAEDVHSASSYGSAGTHFVDLWIGNPAQKRTLAVMTGSDFTAFPCGDCTDCGDRIPPYDAATSATFSTIPCGLCASTSLPSHTEVGETCIDGKLCQTSIHTFVEGSSWAGYEAKDGVYIGGTDLGDTPESAIVGTDVPARHGFPLVFACQTSAKNWYRNEVKDGIVGFSSADTSFIKQMYLSGRLRHPRFSLCFNRMLKSKKGTVTPRSAENAKSAGVVTLGGYDPKYLVTPMTFAQNVNHAVDTAYRVYVTAMYLRERGGMSVIPGDNGMQKLRKVVLDPSSFNAGGGLGGGAKIDSGSPFTVLDKSVEGPFRDAWKKATGGTEFKFGPQELTLEEVARMPTILFQFQGYKDVDKSVNPNTVPNMAGDLDPSSPYDVLVAMPASHYMELNPKSGMYHARILFDELSGTILGANLIQGHNIAYYLDEGRIGFAESSICEPYTTASGTAVDAADDDTYRDAAKEIKRADEMGWEGVYYVVDDDMFMATGAESTVTSGDRGYKVKGHGTCLTTGCRVGMGIAYFLFGCMVAFLFLLYRHRRRQMQQDEQLHEEAVELSSEDMVQGPFDAAYRDQGNTHFGGDDVEGVDEGMERDVSADDFERTLMMNAQIAVQGNTNMSNFR